MGLAMLDTKFFFFKCLIIFIICKSDNIIRVHIKKKKKQHC